MSRTSITLRVIYFSMIVIPCINTYNLLRGSNIFSLLFHLQEFTFLPHCK